MEGHAAEAVTSLPDGEDLHRQTVSEAYAALGTSSRGLSAAEAAVRLRRAGPNTLETVRRKPLMRVLIENFTHLMALLLWAGGLIGFLAQMPELGVAIWLVNLINGLFSFWQEYRAERAVAALHALLPAQARVLREGVVQAIPRAEVVPGDLLILAEGDLVAADGRLVEAAELRVDQATLTGESRPISKGIEAYTAPAAERTALPNLVFAGTTVVAGTGKALVYATGMASAFGMIAHLTQSVAETPSPLQRELSRVTRTVTMIAIAVGVAFFLLSISVAGISLAESLIFAMGMIVAFVPEGLLPTVTLALAIGVQRMARRNALVKRLSAVETLGCTQIICTDKTGTLTQNAMTVRQIWAAGHSYELDGVGYNPQGSLREADQPLAAPPADLCLLLRAAALCNDARLLPPDTSSAEGQPLWTILGDPTEAALVVAARKLGLDPASESATAPRLHEIPFESRRKLMSTLHRPGGKSLTLYTKGAPDEVLARCVSVRIDGNTLPLDADLRTTIVTAKDRFAREGLRVLGVAMRELPARQSARSAEALECELVFLGLAAMQDPPRPEVAAAVAQCHRAGIRIVMITGDDGLTATSIAQRLAIVEGSQPRLVSGTELDTLSEAQLVAALQDEVIFARVAPEHKLRIVTTLQGMGHVVAVTGDGVNDAPALKQADIGVAMGMVGTDVARESADMILTDDNFATIVHAIEEGRAVYANIRRFVTYIFTSNVPEAVPFVLFALSGGRIPLPLTVMQVLAIDLGTDMLPALALGAEPAEPGVMDRPPRRLDEHIITRPMLLYALGYLGLIQSIVALLAFYAAYWGAGYFGQWLDLPGEGLLYQTATTMTLAAIVATQVGNLFVQRARRDRHTPTAPNRLIWIGIAVELTLIVALVYLPWLQRIFGTAPLAAWHWLLLMCCMPVLWLAGQLARLVRRHRTTGGGPARGALTPTHTDS